jgi:hypothetical protein
MPPTSPFFADQFNQKITKHGQTPLDRPAQGRLRRFHRQVKMVSHQDIRVDLPPELVRRLKKRHQKSLGRTWVLEQIPPIISPIDYVMQRSWVFDP